MFQKHRFSWHTLGYIIIIAAAHLVNCAKNQSELDYPKIDLVYAESDSGKSLEISRISTDGHPGFITAKVDHAFKKVIFTCEYKSPTEWRFQCPTDNSDNIVQISKTTERKPGESEPVYKSNLTIKRSLFHHYYVGTDQSLWNIDVMNITCQTVKGGQNKNITTVLSSHNKKQFHFAIRPNSLISLRCSSANPRLPNNPCYLTLKVDLTSATYSCTANKDISNASTTISTIDCSDQLDYCSSLTDTQPPGCLEVKNGKKLETQINWETTGSRTIACELNGTEVYALLFSLPTANSTSMHYWTIEDAVNANTTVVEVRPIYKRTKYYQKEEVDFGCWMYSSIFAIGAEFFYVTKNKLIQIQEPENGMNLINPTTDLDKSNKHIHFTRQRITLDTNMSAIMCRAPVINSLMWKNAIYNLTVYPSTKPSITLSHKENSDHIVISCTAIGSPKPHIEWFYKNKDYTSKSEAFNPADNDELITSTFNISKAELAKDRYARVTCKCSNVAGVDDREFKYPPNDTLTTPIIALIGVISVTTIILVSVIALRLKRKKGNFNSLEKDVRLFFDGDDATQAEGETDPSLMAQRIAYNKEIEIPLESIEIGTPLGSGAYGMVFRGIASGGKCRSSTEVAIKTLKPNVEPAYFKSLLTELKLIIFLGEHENIINLLGACTGKLCEMELFIVLEFCSQGELGRFLKKHRSDIVWNPSLCAIHERESNDAISYRNLLTWSYQIATGMEYIAAKKVVHADLATRNVLLTDDLTAKLCDFGLSRQLYNYSEYVKKQQEPLPWRWMSIESLRDLEFSTQSDVWAYGITLWEIFSMAEVPYPGQSWSSEFLQWLSEGGRMQKPVNCPQSIFVVMKSCWKENPKDRPSFCTMKNSFQKFFGDCDYTEI